jgi:hypothetical protein
MSAEPVTRINLRVKKLNSEILNIEVEDPATMTVGKIWELTNAEENLSEQDYVLINVSPDRPNCKRFLNFDRPLAEYLAESRLIGRPDIRLEVIPLPRPSCAKGGKCSALF